MHIVGYFVEFRSFLLQICPFLRMKRLQKFLKGFCIFSPNFGTRSNYLTIRITYVMRKVVHGEYESNQALSIFGLWYFATFCNISGYFFGFGNCVQHCNVMSEIIILRILTKMHQSLIWIMVADNVPFNVTLIMMMLDCIKSTCLQFLRTISRCACIRWCKCNELCHSIPYNIFFNNIIKLYTFAFGDAVYICASINTYLSGYQPFNTKVSQCLDPRQLMKHYFIQCNMMDCWLDFPRLHSLYINQVKSIIIHIATVLKLLIMLLQTEKDDNLQA